KRGRGVACATPALKSSQKAGESVDIDPIIGNNNTVRLDRTAVHPGVFVEAISRTAFSPRLYEAAPAALSCRPVLQSRRAGCCCYPGNTLDQPCLVHVALRSCYSSTFRHHGSAGRGAGFSSRSTCSKTAPATSTPVVFSIPSSPGDEFTSITIGPSADSIRSTPATRRPSARAAASAVLRYSAGSLNELALPPRCRFDRNSPATACRFLAATTRPPSTTARMSAPRDSLMNFWIRMFSSSPWNASITELAACSVSASTTPIP